MKLRIYRKFNEVINALRSGPEIFQVSREGSTRWNSLYNMCHSYVSNRKAIRMILEESDAFELQLTRAEEAIVDDLISILSNFKEVSELLQGFSYGTLYLVSLCGHMIRRSLQDYSCVISSYSNDIIMPLLSQGLRFWLVLSPEHEAAGILNPIVAII